MKNQVATLYKKHETVYTDPVSGKFNTVRFITMSSVVLLYFILPCLTWNGNQAFLFDVTLARFYFFNLVFWPEDFFILAILVIFLVLLLFAVTVYAGRVWCGFFCPQSIWVRITVFFARIIEGNRHARKKFDEASIFDSGVFFKRFLKNIIWILFSLFTSFIFIGYFVPMSFLIKCVYNFDFKHWSFFWIAFLTVLTFLNISWFREQFCFLICPYARFQSVMFDENTLIVAYDSKRGEKRGSRKKGFDYKNNGLGDCVDCKKCVTCCPAGIDIRNGLQMECISCAECIDACNAVMNKMGYKTGLIRYMKESDMLDGIKIFSKTRFFAYVFALLFLSFLFSYGLVERNLTQFSISKSQVELFNINKDNLIENTYILKITNKTKISKNYNISINDSNFKFIGMDKFSLEGEDTIILDIKLIAENKSTERFKEVFFKISASENDFVIKKSRFIMPI